MALGAFMFSLIKKSTFLLVLSAILILSGCAGLLDLIDELAVEEASISDANDGSRAGNAARNVDSSDKVADDRPNEWPQQVDPGFGGVLGLSLADDGALFVTVHSSGDVIYRFSSDGSLDWASRPFESSSGNYGSVIGDNSSVYVAGILSIEVYDRSSGKGGMPVSSVSNYRFFTAPALAPDEALLIPYQWDAYNVMAGEEQYGSGLEIVEPGTHAFRGSIILGPFGPGEPSGMRIERTPAVAVDGSVFFVTRGGGLYVASTDENTLPEENPTQILVESTSSIPHSAPAIGNDGTVYVSIGSILYAVGDEEELWSTPLSGEPVQASPAIGPDGTVYVATGDKLFAVGGSGTIVWERELSISDNTGIAVGDDGTVYIGTENIVYGLSPENGEAVWSFETAAGAAVTGTPVIDDEGTLYFADESGLIHAVESRSRGMALSSWPSSGGGVRQQARQIAVGD